MRWYVMPAVQAIVVNKSSGYAGESVVKVNGHRCRKKAIKAGENDMRHDIAVVGANEQSTDGDGWVC